MSPSTRRVAFACAITVACIGGAIAIRFLFGWVGATLYFASFFPAVLIAAVYAGVWSGIVTALVSVVFVWWALVSPRYTFAPLDITMASNFALFLLSSGLIIWIAHQLTVARRDLVLAMDELQHRGKNTFAVVEAIVHQTLAHDQTVADKLTGRIRAVSTTNDLVSASPDMTVDLRELFKHKLGDFGAIRQKGQSVRISSNVARNLSLIFHELRTNALKYGALSHKPGYVDLIWRNDGDTLHLTWHEQDGPTVMPPDRNGFGTRLITTLVKSLKGTARFDYRETGLAR